MSDDYPDAKVSRICSISNNIIEHAAGMECNAVGRVQLQLGRYTYYNMPYSDFLKDKYSPDNAALKPFIFDASYVTDAGEAIESIVNAVGEISIILDMRIM